MVSSVPFSFEAVKNKMLIFMLAVVKFHTGLYEGFGSMYVEKWSCIENWKMRKLVFFSGGSVKMR